MSATARPAASPRRMSRRSGRPPCTPLVPLRLNEWAPAGTWDVARHAGIAMRPRPIAFRFQARDLNLVMGPTSRGASIPFRVFLDGVPVSTDPVSTWDPRSGVLTEQRTYQLIRQSRPHRRPPVRDRVPRRGRGGVLLHLRLSRRPMATFAFIHGAGDVGWYWHLVEAELRARGHETVAPDLPIEDDAPGSRSTPRRSSTRSAIDRT